MSTRSSRKRNRSQHTAPTVVDLNFKNDGRRTNNRQDRVCSHPFYAVFVAREEFAGLDEDGSSIFVNHLACEECEEGIGQEALYDVFVQDTNLLPSQTPVLELDDETRKLIAHDEDRHNCTPTCPAVRLTDSVSASV